MTAYETIIVERPAPRIARIVMNRPEARNAQNLQMTYDLNAAFDSAVQDDAVKVIILAGSGPHFSAGHDLRPTGKNAAGVDFPPIGNWGGQGQGIFVHRGRLERRGGASARHGQSRSPKTGALVVRAGAGAKDCRKAFFRAEADKRGRQPVGRRHGPARGDRSGIRAASAMSRA